MYFRDQKFTDFIRSVNTKEIFATTFNRESEYLNIPKLIDWYVENGVFFERSMNRFILHFLKIEKSHPGICFYNAQLMTLNNNCLGYYEGIMFSTGNGKAVHHGFNAIKNKVIDVTYVKNQSDMDSDLVTLPGSNFKLFYHGIYIPREFIKSLPSEDGNYPNRPLLLKYFEYCVKT